MYWRFIQQENPFHESNHPYMLVFEYQTRDGSFPNWIFCIIYKIIDIARRYQISAFEINIYHKKRYAGWFISAYLPVP